MDGWNISCHPYLRCLAHWLTDLISLAEKKDARQMAEIWGQITDHLEDSISASVLISIDYGKAFNRLDHSACLRAFADRGASNQLIKLLASFLTGWQMAVKVEEKTSQLRNVNTGASQGGSVLGTYIFNVGTDHPEEGFEQEREVAH